MEQLAVPPGRDAQAGRGDARPARHRRPAQPCPAVALGRAAAAGRHRLGADRPPAGAGARRADLRARPDRGRGGPGRHHPARARPRHHRRARRAPAGAGRAVRRPDRAGCPATDRRRRRPPPRCSPTQRSRRRSSSSAGSPGWSPLPLSVRDARRSRGAAARAAGADLPPAPARRDPNGTGGARARRVVVRYGDVSPCAASTSTCAPARSPRSWAATAPASRRCCGRCRAQGRASGGDGLRRRRRDPGRLSSREARRLVGLVPQTAGDLLYLDSVAAECRQADRESASAAGARRAARPSSSPGIEPTRHPRDLSEGPAAGARARGPGLAAEPPVVLLDEPTRGLDYPAKAGLADIVERAGRAGQGRCRVATHDVEFVAAVADRVVVMADGEVVADGPTADVVAASPAFAPQVAKILAPEVAHRRPGRRALSAVKADRRASSR